MILSTVTISGVDDTVEPQALAELSKAFDFVEWGVLLGPSEWMGKKPRFPSFGWLERLRRWCVGSGQMRLSGHLCGHQARWLLAGSYTPTTEYGRFWPMLSRAQVNTAGHETTLAEAGVTVMKSLGQQWILQQDGHNNHLLERVVEMGLSAVGLYDMSYGKGRVAGDWPAADDLRLGYAGGLSPDNLEDHLPRIATAGIGRRIWIDMESGVRTENRLDVGRVLRVLSICDAWRKK